MSKHITDGCLGLSDICVLHFYFMLGFPFQLVDPKQNTKYYGTICIYRCRVFLDFIAIPKPNPKERIESRTHHACLKESVFVERLWVVLCTVGLLAFRCVKSINVFAGSGCTLLNYHFAKEQVLSERFLGFGNLTTRYRFPKPQR